MHSTPVTARSLTQSACARAENPVALFSITPALRNSAPQHVPFDELSSARTGSASGRVFVPRLRGMLAAGPHGAALAF